ncbi:MAG: MAPEG family protein [Parvularculaceae bacterium]
MTSLEAAGLWIGLNALLLIYISYRVGQARNKYGVNLGDGGNPDVLKAIRVHGNYTEYAPAALLGLFALASLGAHVLTVHFLGAVFFLARIAHLLGLGMGVWEQGRFVGTLFTMLTLLATGGLLLFHAIF